MSKHSSKFKHGDELKINPFCFVSMFNDRINLIPYTFEVSEVIMKLALFLIKPEILHTHNIVDTTREIGKV